MVSLCGSTPKLCWGSVVGAATAAAVTGESRFGNGSTAKPDDVITGGVVQFLYLSLLLVFADLAVQSGIGHIAFHRKEGM